MSDFAVSKGLAWQVSGHMGFPDDCFPVFHPEFETWCDEYAKELIPTNKDPYLLGHFSDNELQCPKNMLDRTLKMDLEKYPEMKYNTQAAKDWLDQRKPQGWKIDNITDNDRNDYIGHVFDTYYRLTSTAIKKYDPDHLYIGSRCYGYALSCPQVFRAAGKYLGLLSCNYYRAWKPDNERMNMWTKESNLPFLITEWYAKGMDSGLPNNTGAGWTVKTQKDRAWFYNNFTLALMENKNCVGWHWFKYRDNNPEDLTTEPSNRDSNKGVVTYDYKPYVELLDEMKKLNDNVYPLIDYFDAR